MSIVVKLSYEEQIINALNRVDRRRGEDFLARALRDAAAIRGVLAPLYEDRVRLQAACELALRAAAAALVCSTCMGRHGAELVEEALRLRGDVEPSNHELDEALSRLQAAAQTRWDEARRLHAALSCYGRHDRSCPQARTFDPALVGGTCDYEGCPHPARWWDRSSGVSLCVEHGRCSCGFAEATA